VSCALALPPGHLDAEELVIDAHARGVPVVAPGTQALLSDAVVSVADTREEWLRGMRLVLNPAETVGLRAAALEAVVPLGWRARATEWLAIYDTCRRQAAQG
jgi:hypothetical protein